MGVLEIDLLPALSDNYIYLLREPETGTVAVVDPGAPGPVIDALETRGWGLDLILNTHHHADHTGGNAELKARYGARVVGPGADRHRIAELDEPAAESDTVQVGTETAHVIETPGHTSGHISLYFAGSRALFCGDTLFALG
ncbi:MAG TPA: hydroxyacylglutathione hydrolase family protein, partial [Alphaproteobacteria bacterium]|nr:hydroxyacylglutathione hydrolase family protein [Alphaproteobacteria bacterium]